jgi:hypothetical protein
LPGRSLIWVIGGRRGSFRGPEPPLLELQALPVGALVVGAVVGGVVVVPPLPTEELAAAAPTESMVVLFSTGLGTVPVKTMKVTGPSVPPFSGFGLMPGRGPR